MAGSSLQSVDFVRSDDTPTQGLISVGEPDISGLHIDEQAAVFDARLLRHIDFIFFRRYSDGRSSQVAAYIVDNSDERLDGDTLAQLHLQVWLHGTAPLLYVSLPSRSDVLTCVRGHECWSDRQDQCHYNPVETLEIAGVIDHELKKSLQYSAFRLADGTFWEDPRNSSLAAHSKTAHQLLIQAIVEADNGLDGENNPILRRLLLLMVLIKYLEDRRAFPNPSWFGRYHKGAKSFFEVLQGNDPEEVYRLLDFLERKFNGDIFSLPCEGRQKLTKEALRRFAELVETRTLRSQRYLWDQFSFEHLPVEMISHIYQRFVQGGHGTVYTPPFLASLLLDQAMPYEKLTGQERVLDPACGSGIFLVGAFRRLVNVWRSRHQWKRLDVTSLKQILKQSIYGIELDPNAVNLASFSLSLALCDALKPEVIWSELRFDPLRNTNLLEADFFDILNRSRQGEPTLFEKGFDVVIGNPPFESELSPAGDKVNQAAQKQDPHHRSLPDKQTAYLFLEQGLSVLNPDGRACLIQPSQLLYNRKAQNFRTAVFQKHQVDTVLDFTSIRKLYDEADPKTIAVLARAETPDNDHWINHWTFRRTITAHERICFELDHYDRHRVSQKQVEEDSHEWRANLLGGGRLND
ncbi:MAG: N-6 DNA methylase, partial [Deltaproteobacteria bacterium]|nr:N-6 DNA methylase [Deltaproteobacteria bacterium]